MDESYRASIFISIRLDKGFERADEIIKKISVENH